jgi:hypothetical protein
MPADQVFQLINTLKNNPDADRRADAAAELGTLDGQKYPEIVGALIEALMKDSSTQVRRAAATALGELRPKTLDAANALKQAAENDESLWVRTRARTVRWGYGTPEPPPSPRPPAGGRVIPVPPPGPDGRLAPVPLPAPPIPPGSRPLPKPPVEDEGRTAPPAKPLPPPAAPAPKPLPPQPPLTPIPTEEGPIFIAPPKP